MRNLASVLRINPGRIRVTNIVPGNRRRLRSGAGSGSDLDIRFDIAEVDPCETSSKKCAGGSGRRRLSEQASFRELIAVVRLRMPCFVQHHMQRTDREQGSARVTIPHACEI